MSSKKQKRLQRTEQERFDINEFSRFNKPIDITPRNLSQEKYLCDLLDDDAHVIFATGPAGTGKTMLATLAGIRALKKGDVRRIVLTRPAVGVDGEKHGFLPGDLNSKMEPWTKPIFDVLHEHFDKRETTRMLDEEIIEISPLAFMRGRTLKHSWVIADECQSTTPSQMKMLLTRLGEGSKMIITGDLEQADRGDDNGLRDFLSRLRKQNSNTIRIVDFRESDIERHPVVAEVLDIYSQKTS